MNPPTKPFPTYKWRWLSVQPSEGLLRAPVFLGVLRALDLHEGESYSSANLRNRLIQVRADTGTTIDLARTPERNLFRNSGQYWKGTGLLSPVSRVVELTSLGKRVASGHVTHDEFAALMIRNTVLPNPITYSPSELKKWKDAGLRIKPFEIILSVMTKLGSRGGVKNAYLTPNELIKIIIPLAGVKKNLEDMCIATEQYRAGVLNLDIWPNCAPESNDRRLAREFLLFLESFEICRIEGSGGNYEQRFVLDEPLQDIATVEESASFLEDSTKTEEEIATSQLSIIPTLIERRRISTRVLRRPGQAKFRREVLAAANGRCLFTNEAMPDVLEAAHIIPVEHGGGDMAGNGLCLRIDIHRLFDAGKIRIDSVGTVWRSPQVKVANSYAHLPTNVTFPSSVIAANIEWRKNYL